MSSEPLFSRLLGARDEDAPERLRPAVHFDPTALLSDAVPLAAPREAEEAYERALALDDEPEPEPVRETVTPPSIEPDAVAGELALDGLDASALAQARKDFARRNHPDHVPAVIHAQALARMKIANALIDEAEQRLKRGR